MLLLVTKISTAQAYRIHLTSTREYCVRHWYPPLPSPTVWLTLYCLWRAWPIPVTQECGWHVIRFYKRYGLIVIGCGSVDDALLTRRSGSFWRLFFFSRWCRVLHSLSAGHLYTPRTVIPALLYLPLISRLWPGKVSEHNEWPLRRSVLIGWPILQPLSPVIIVNSEWQYMSYYILVIGQPSS